MLKYCKYLNNNRSVLYCSYNLYSKLHICQTPQFLVQLCLFRIFPSWTIIVDIKKHEIMTPTINEEYLAGRKP